MTDSDGQNTIGLIWTTTGRPLVDVDWYRNNMKLNRSTYRMIDILRDRVNATYDHILTIPRHCVDDKPVKYTCKAYSCDGPRITISYGKDV